MERTISKYALVLCFIFGTILGINIGSQITMSEIASSLVMIDETLLMEFAEFKEGQPYEVVVGPTEEIGNITENIELNPAELEAPVTIDINKVDLSKTLEEPEEVIPEPEIIKGDILEVPDYCGSFKAFMSKNALTSVSSAQYKLQQSESMWIDEYGMQRCNDDYVVAVGTYFADSIGDRLLITMTSGVQFTATVGDFKANIHTDPGNMYNPGSMSVLEFIVDMNSLDKSVMKMGDVSYLPSIDMSGKVSTMQKIN